MVKPLIVLVVVIIAVAAFFGWDYYRRGVVGPVVKLQQVVQKPFDKYTYESLIKTEFSPSEVTIGSLVSDNPEFVSRMFYFYVGGPSTRSGTLGQANPGQAKKVSGLVNFPKKDGTYPVIVMYRGYIDRETYKTGDGTRRSGEMFAQNGFITVAPDFLGYGQSDMPAGNPMEERFQVYTAAITLLKSIPNLNKAFTSAGTGVRADAAKVGILYRRY
ncbi:MAG: Peptidase [Candidatus Curtissbacteria bacterium GW2011_GWA1_40_16]|uniref:Peptidase n=1 Tax=Candidatus Curtissbacteria bacterium GW2011_GWA1_40_16 TaxID=1618405 RepID=A0A0G0RFE7_9BACT|nr:MAG: Peptidase [Candidatus Curtissbacteria bacterium GW2011_GWA1_40_16]